MFEWHATIIWVFLRHTNIFGFFFVPHMLCPTNMKGVVSGIVVATSAIIGTATTIMMMGPHELKHKTGLWSGHLSEAIIKQDDKYYEVWGLICTECGKVEVDTFPGAALSQGPETAWTDTIVDESWLRSWNQTGSRQFIIDYRSDAVKEKMATTTNKQ